ncbi:MAG TPA: terminase large subunit [Anaerolineae bacterium]|jgi:hypothetical protein
MFANDLRFALDPVAFAESFGFKPDQWQIQVLRWSGRQLLLNCARQSGKSTIAAILAVHTAMYCRSSLILLVSPSQRQSSELFKKVTDILSMTQNKPTMLEDNKLSCTFSGGSRIVSLPSNEATIRGFSGATLIVEDEASRVNDDLYRALRPMLAVSGGRLVLMSTPFGRRGHFFDEWSNGTQDWCRVTFTAAENPRISREFLAEERRSLGDWWYRQEYECQFMNRSDQVFNYETVIGAVSNDVPCLFPAHISTMSSQNNAISSEIKPLWR